MSVLSDFRRIADALERLAATTTRGITALEAQGPPLDRLEDLELNRVRFEAEMEGLLLKAEGKLKAASNAEARERTMRKSYEDDADPFGEDGDEIEALDAPIYVEGGDEEGLQPVHVGLEKNSKDYARRLKFS